MRAAVVECCPGAFAILPHDQSFSEQLFREEQVLEGAGRVSEREGWERRTRVDKVNGLDRR